MIHWAIFMPKSKYRRLPITYKFALRSRPFVEQRNMATAFLLPQPLNVQQMANQIEVLKQTELLGQQFEVYGTPQEPLFKAQDVADMLQLTNSRDMVSRVDEDERCKLNLRSQAGETWMLTENGLYEVLMQSRKPIAKQFKKGVKAILKEIHTNGGYISHHSEDTPEMIMARALQVAQSTIERHAKQLEAAQATITHQSEQLKAQAPKVEYTDNVLNSVNTYTSTQMAKELELRTAE